MSSLEAKPDSYIRIGSETKTFTVTALLELVDEHRIKLDDPISAYVPGVRNGDRITLRHLAEMRSGLFPYTADADFQRDLLSDPQRYFTDLLTRLVNGWPNDRIDELMPWCWADSQEPPSSAEGAKGP